MVASVEGECAKRHCLTDRATAVAEQVWSYLAAVAPTGNGR